MEIEVPVRLQLYLARCGIGSRRRCESYIESGLVRVNGRPVTTPGTKVTSRDTVVYRNRRVVPETHRRYLALDKPRGYLCTSSDPHGRPVASELFCRTYKERLFHVGRLDASTEGLIFYTNDGEFAKVVTHPASCIEKEYLIETPDQISEEVFRAFRRGVVYNGVRYKIDGFSVIGNHRVLIRLHEGKNREIRELFRSAGRRIDALKRVRIGIVRLATIPRGGFRELTVKEKDWFLKKRGGR